MASNAGLGGSPHWLKLHSRERRLAQRARELATSAGRGATPRCGVSPTPRAPIRRLRRGAGARPSHARQPSWTLLALARSERGPSLSAEGGQRRGPASRRRRGGPRHGGALSTDADVDQRPSSLRRGRLTHYTPPTSPGSSATRAGDPRVPLLACVWATAPQHGPRAARDEERTAPPHRSLRRRARPTQVHHQHLHHGHLRPWGAMVKLDEYCKKEAVRVLANNKSDEGTAQRMHVEMQKRSHDEQSASASSATPTRLLKKNKSNEEDFGHIEPRTRFQTDEELMPNNSELAWMRALKGLMQAQTGDIKASIGEQTRRVTAVERIIIDHQKDHEP